MAMCGIVCVCKWQRDGVAGPRSERGSLALKDSDHVGPVLPERPAQDVLDHRAVAVEVMLSGVASVLPHVHAQEVGNAEVLRGGTGEAVQES